MTTRFWSIGFLNGILIVRMIHSDGKICWPIWVRLGYWFCLCLCWNDAFVFQRSSILYFNSSWITMHLSPDFHLNARIQIKRLFRRVKPYRIDGGEETRTWRKGRHFQIWRIKSEQKCQNIYRFMAVFAWIQIVP